MAAYVADFLLWISLGLALVQLAGFTGERDFTRGAAMTLFFCLTFCFGALIYSFVISDFSLKVVFENSHSSKPLIYKISGAWGNHEGSLLMMTWILSLYGFLYSRTKFHSRALAVQGLICLLFIAFMKFTSNPFDKLPFPMPDGQGLNPLLQDIGLAFHPPVLYAGYVGFSIVFSISVGYLLEGAKDKTYARTARQWCITAWSFLTLGIGLGSWWAYRELGWGGFWFWDPVENVSLMPWLSGTALLHSLLITAKRNTLKRWTILLAIITFGLSLSGFFLVRSGVLSSVHSFASDPARGIMILSIFSILLGFAFVVYAFQAHKLKTTGEYDLLSRETGILLNNLLLAVMCATVFIGTIYPLALSALGGDSISVGPPFYAATFLPAALIVIYLCATATLARWRVNRVKQFLVRISAPAGVPKVVALIAYLFFGFTISQALFLLVSLYLLCAVLWEFKHRRHWENLPMIISHGGLAVLVLGILMATTFPAQTEANMKAGDKIKLANFDISLNSVKEGLYENYAYREGDFEITRKGSEIAHLYPQMRVYPVEQSATTEAAIYRHNFLSDIYIIIGEKRVDGLYAVRAYYKPFVNLIWLGCAIMFGGGILRLLLQLSKSRKFKVA